MKYSVCTISFRHQLISLENIAHWAKSHQFDAIELWGVHAKNLRQTPELNREWLAAQGLSVSMVSDYLPLDGDREKSLANAKEMCELTKSWGTNKLRTFSGGKGSANVGEAERAAWTERLREYCQVAEDQGIQLVVETHPNTLADTLQSTIQLIEEVNHPALKINFDVIHVWEMGSDPELALEKIAPLIVHLHFKNITDRKLLNVFAPGNVYAPAGSREGMTSLFKGAYDFNQFLTYLLTQSTLAVEDMDASLEWFGPDVFTTLNEDRKGIFAIESALTGDCIQQPAAVASFV